MMRSASRTALETLRAKEDSVFGGKVSAQTLTTLADELYAVADLLVAQPRLRRTVGDPATAPERRAELVHGLLDGKVDKHTLQLVEAAVSERWSSPWDLTDSLENAGDEALFAAADKDKSFDTVEDELFRFERILENEGEATGLLDEVSVDPNRRISLLESLVRGKVSDVTLALLRHAVSSQRKRSVLLAIDDLLDRAAARKERSVARVLTAVELTDKQVKRLAKALSEMYGRDISVRTAIEPSVRGGLVIRVGDEVIDGSIATRLADARTTMAG
jgi:F-type H+-transporting ATPase subunit delta